MSTVNFLILLVFPIQLLALFLVLVLCFIISSVYFESALSTVLHGIMGYRMCRPKNLFQLAHTCT